MKNKHKNIWKMTLKSLVVYIIAMILIGLFMFFVRGDLVGKLFAIIVCPLVIPYLIYAYKKENRADNDAVLKTQSILDGSYFNTPEWKEKYLLYINEHPFERAKYNSMKKDLLNRFKRREDIFWMLIWGFFIFSSVCLMIENLLMGIVGVILFGTLFYYLAFAEYIGVPVRRWLKGDIDYEILEKSYLNAKFLTYKKNGLAFGVTHIHGYTDKKIYAIDYRLVEGISRKVVRLKKYEDGIFSSDEYQHFAVIHVRLPYSGRMENVEIELNEYQVQMAIDAMYAYNADGLSDKTTIEERLDNIVV